MPKKTPKIWKNAKIPYKWQPSGTIEANIAYTFEFIAPDPNITTLRGPSITKNTKGNWINHASPQAMSIRGCMTSLRLLESQGIVRSRVSFGKGYSN